MSDWSKSPQWQPIRACNTRRGQWAADVAFRRSVRCFPERRGAGHAGEWGGGVVCATVALMHRRRSPISHLLWIHH